MNFYWLFFSIFILHSFIAAVVVVFKINNVKNYLIKHALKLEINLLASHHDFHIDKCLHALPLSHAFVVDVYQQTPAPMSPRGRISSAFYTYRTRTSGMFVQKSLKLHSVACQLSVKQVLVDSFRIFFVYQLYTQRKI